MRQTVRQLRKYLHANPDDHATASALGLMLQELDRREAALRYSRLAVRLAPDCVLYRCQLSKMLAKFGLLDEAIRTQEQAVQLTKGSAPVYTTLSEFYLAQGQVGDALKVASRAVALNAAERPAYRIISECAIREHSSREAMQFLGGQLPQTADREAMLLAFNTALTSRGRYAEAAANCQDMLAATPTHISALITLSHIAFVLRSFHEAESYIDRALESHPEHPNACYSKLFLLRALDRQAEARAFSHTHKTAIRIANPIKKYGPFEWDGNTEARGKTILVRAYNGFGDTIYHLPLIRGLKQAGATTVVECPSTLRPLIETAPGIDLAIATFLDECPLFDYECVIEDLLNWWDFPVVASSDYVPYFHLARKTNFDSVKTPEQKVGLIWQGSPLFMADPYRRRSVPLNTLLPLRDIHGIRLYSLQVGPGTAQLGELPDQSEITDLGSRFHDFMDTAKALKALDVIVTIDTSVAHLAGALGKTTAVMLPYAPACWYWPLQADACPHYPTSCLFWQDEPGNWESVVARIRCWLVKMERPILRSSAGYAAKS